VVGFAEEKGEDGEDLEAGETSNQEEEEVTVAVDISSAQMEEFERRMRRKEEQEKQERISLLHHRAKLIVEKLGPVRVEQVRGGEGQVLHSATHDGLPGLVVMRHLAEDAVGDFRRAAEEMVFERLQSGRDPLTGDDETNDEEEGEVKD
jgi:hypothetical protein